MTVSRRQDANNVQVRCFECSIIHRELIPERHCGATTLHFSPCFFSTCSVIIHSHKRSLVRKTQLFRLLGQTDFWLGTFAFIHSFFHSMTGIKQTTKVDKDSKGTHRYILYDESIKTFRVPMPKLYSISMQFLLFWYKANFNIAAHWPDDLSE